MTTARRPFGAAAALLATLAMVVAVLPMPGAAAPAAPVVDARAVTAATDGVRVLVSGAVEDATAAVRAAGGAVLGELPLFDVVVADVPASAVADLETAPGVTGVNANEVVELHNAAAAGASAFPADDQGPETLGAPRLWRNGVDGSGVGIAVLDTGVSKVTDLDGRVRAGIDLSGEGNGVDTYGHGTPVASLAAGTRTGVAPGAHVVPVKIAGRDGRTDVARLLVGLDWIARSADRLDIGVVNLSLGSTPISVDLVDAAVQRLWDLGLVVVVAAGNDGPGTLGTPAGNTHVITVGATRGNDTRATGDDVIAPWSANGFDADGNAKPDVVAPGQSVVAAGAPGSWAYTQHPAGHLGNGHQRVSGTSFSTGLVSGAAALLLHANPDWTPDQVLGQLLATGSSVQGTTATTPWLPKAVRGKPVEGNVGASGTTDATLQELLDLGPPGPATLLLMLGDPRAVIAQGSGWYGSGWYSLNPLGSGWYETDWFGSGWYGSGWYGSGWYGSGWYGSGWYELSWEGSGWYGSGWYGSGWYGSGWY